MAGFNFGTPASSAPTFSLGSNPATGGTSGFNFGASATGTSATPGLQFNAPTSTPGTVNFGAPAATSSSGFTFGSTGGLTMGTPATNQPSLGFGATPATTTQGLSFGATQGAATQSTLTFGSTPATTQQLTFGNSATSTQPLTFGSTPATSQPLSFGSTPATLQPLNFGSTPANTQSLSFGSTPAASTQGLTFGSTPATTQPLTFGSTAQPQPPATTQPTLNFGLSTPATTASTAFTLGAPATTASLSFGLGGQTAVTKPTLSFGTATTTSTPSLLNFSAPKTTTTTGFSLSVSSGAGTGGLFAVPTTSTAITSAPTAFKGLGGVDTSTTQGNGPKDIKSVKENIVNPEIMQTLDVFKNFVKQQKNLGCEVSRAPAKPMHKVTEDADALNKLLTSVSSALQKNKVIANKLKSDTTKCLSLCEMAQRTHDTPPGLQNDNVAPLEFFIQLVSKFERDIQVLRQEIDNTEKHVNSLSYPAILTPQELSIALRRLHDSFVALAGRLQATHVGVIAQKERHLSLRRHFLKDHTNIFDTPFRTAKKPLCPVGLPKPGPTPFSSMGGIHNMSFMAGQDKHVTFATGPTSLTGWGASTISNTPSSTFVIQSPYQPQAIDNQNFQLGKPPAGNKRGKR